MIKILPFNDNPPIKCSASHANILGILTNDSLVNVPNAIFKNTAISGHNILNNTWNFVGIDTGIELKQYDGDTSAFSFTVNQGMYFNYRIVQGDFSIVTQIEYQKDDNAWSKTGLMLRDSLDEETAHIKFSITPNNGIYVETRASISDELITSIGGKGSAPIWLKIDRSNQVFVVSKSFDGLNWVGIQEIKDFLPNIIYVGCFTSPNSNSVWDWIYSNYIQLHCDPNLKPIYDNGIDFFLGPRKDHFYYSNLPWIKSESIDHESILLREAGITKFIVDAIRRGYYVEIYLNEAKLPMRAAYNGYNYDRTNLIYGYNLDEHTFTIAGYNGIDSIFGSSIVSISQVELAYETSNQIELIYLLKPVGPWIPYVLEIKTIVTYLEDYIAGNNSYEKFAIHIKPLDRLFGINSYDVIINNFDEIFNGHIRTIHLLYEHKKIMLDRILYLSQLELCRSSLEPLTNLAKEFQFIVDSFKRIRNLQLKNKVSENENYFTKALNELSKLKEIERKVITDLLNALKSMQN